MVIFYKNRKIFVIFFQIPSKNLEYTWILGNPNVFLKFILLILYYLLFYTQVTYYFLLFYQINFIYRKAITRDQECEQACHDRYMGLAHENCDEGDEECFRRYKHEADKCVKENRRGDDHSCEDRCHHHAQGSPFIFKPFLNFTIF